MRISTIRKYIFVTICLILCWGVQAQNIKSATIHVDKAGTLSALISSEDKYSITDLTLSGYLNGSDIEFIRDMTGRTVLDSITPGIVSMLNLEDTNIVKGGDAYIYLFEYSCYDYTKDNSISSSMFRDLSNLTSLTLPKSINYIGSNAFNGCTKLTSILIPTGVTTINAGAFSNCTGLSSITIPNTVTTIGNSVFYNCSVLTSIAIPDGITSIGDKTFDGCTGLASVTIPGNVKTIGYDAFANCVGLKSFTIPCNVTSISDYAFSYCTGLPEIHCKALTPPSATSATFIGIHKTCTKLYIPKGTSDVYKSANGWSGFANIIEEESTPILQIQANNTKVYTEQDAIVVTDIKSGDVITIYSTSGTLIQTIKATDNEIRITVPAHQMYLIKIEDKTFKAAL